MVYRDGMLAFFQNLVVNNNREWFNANKLIYEREVVDPTLMLVTAMGPLIGSISPHLRADPRKSGGSMFRIYRDTRFSKDKTPYKTWVAVRFPHLSAKDVHAPGYYYSASFHEFVIGCGIWQPDSESLGKIRNRIVERPQEWESICDDSQFKQLFQWTGASLKRPPRGFEKDHPLIDDLKRKDFVVMAAYPAETALRDDLPVFLMNHYQAAKPLIIFLCKALGLPF